MQIDYRKSYSEAVHRLMAAYPSDQAMRLAVGGEFNAFGVVMREILIRAGLRPEYYLIDVGCGSGRLASVLPSYLTGQYLGIDVVPELLEYARSICGRPDWRFEEVHEIVIPENREAADMVCFFSVLTHLLHEDCFRYLIEASRVLKANGTVVFSFLDFHIASHWVVFDGMLTARTRQEATHHNQFLSRDIIHAWAGRLGMELLAIYDGDAPQVQVPGDLYLDDGRPLPEQASLGQSVCILRKV